MVTLGGHPSARVDEYAGLNPDLFEIPGWGVFIDNNSGASLLGTGNRCGHSDQRFDLEAPPRGHLASGILVSGVLGTAPHRSA